MHLARLQTSGFRCLDNFEIEFGPGLNVIVGPNNAGKTAVLEAVSLGLSVMHNPQREIFVNAEDFWHSPDGTGTEQNEFRIVLDLQGVPKESTGYFKDWLVPGIQDLARITVVSRRDANDPDEVYPKWYVGPGVTNGPDAETMRRVRPVFLPPLRDAETHLRPGRRSRIARLIQQIADVAVGQSIVDRFRQVQDGIIGEPPFSSAIERVNERLASASGALHRQVARLEFLEPDFRRITEMLQVRIGLQDMAAFSLAENGLGYNNLLYIATVLSQLSKDSKQDLRLLLIEEPEAHLHPQMQQVLIDALMEASGKYQALGEERTQIIMTSHSPVLAAHVPVEDILVLHHHRVEPSHSSGSRSRPRSGKPLARSIRQFQLDTTTLNDLSRYLDSTKANLFFAEGVLLVEGLAEMLLFPVFAKAINRPLNEHHVSLVNVGGLAFDPFWELFCDLGRLQIPCALVTDSDPRFKAGDKWYRPRGGTAQAQYDDRSLDEVEGDELLFPATMITYGRAYELEQRASHQRSGLKVFRNTKTFEYDLALTEYLPYMVAVCKDMNDGLGSEIEQAVGHACNDRAKAISYFKRFPTRQKAQFAQRLAAHLEPLIDTHWQGQRQKLGDDRGNWVPFHAPPTYISSAIRWVTGDCNWDAL